jgi:plastocyanin
LIGVEDDYYQPAMDSVPTGSNVFWIWDPAGTIDVHNVTWDSGPTGATLPNPSADMQSGQYGPLVFTVPGTYTYHCTHFGTPATGNVMVGSLVVVAH